MKGLDDLLRAADPAARLAAPSRHRRATPWCPASSRVGRRWVRGPVDGPVVRRRVREPGHRPADIDRCDGLHHRT